MTRLCSLEMGEENKKNCATWSVDIPGLSQLCRGVWGAAPWWIDNQDISYFWYGGGFGAMPHALRRSRGSRGWPLGASIITIYPIYPHKCWSTVDPLKVPATATALSALKVCLPLKAKELAELPLNLCKWLFVFSFYKYNASYSAVHHLTNRWHPTVLITNASNITLIVLSSKYSPSQPHK